MRSNPSCFKEDPSIKSEILGLCDNCESILDILSYYKNESHKQSRFIMAQRILNQIENFVNSCLSQSSISGVDHFDEIESIMFEIDKLKLHLI